MRRLLPEAVFVARHSIPRAESVGELESLRCRIEALSLGLAAAVERIEALEARVQELESRRFTLVVCSGMGSGEAN